MNYGVIIIGAGPGGIFAAYELMQKKYTAEGCKLYTTAVHCRV